jgi:hypothetical protein
VAKDVAITTRIATTGTGTSTWFLESNRAWLLPGFFYLSLAKDWSHLIGGFPRIGANLLMVGSGRRHLFIMGPGMEPDIEDGKQGIQGDQACAIEEHSEEA